MEIRHLAAPKLDEAVNLGERILCHRPYRQGPPRMCIERKGAEGQGGQLLIAHNYGHASSGLTYAPGAVRHVNELLLRALGDEGQSDTKARPIHVIGAGVMSLFTAYDLIKKGFQNVTIIAEHFDQLTSHNAGGLLCPDRWESRPLLDQIAVTAYNFYAIIARGEHPDFSAECARFISAYFDADAIDDMDVYVTAGVMKGPREVLVQFDTCPSVQHRRMAFDDCIFMQAHSIMGTLHTFLRSNGVKFIQKRVNAFEEVGDSNNVIVNCTGIGARELCADAGMFPVQGHLIMLKDQNPADLNYLFIHWFDEGKTESGQTVKRAFYLFPKRAPSSSTDGAVGVLGGTFVYDADGNTPNLTEYDILLKNAKAFLAGQL